MDSPSDHENPAIALLSEQCERYAATQKRLEAQLNGVESKLAETKAKYAASKEALDALLKRVTPPATE